MTTRGAGAPAWRERLSLTSAEGVAVALAMVPISVVICAYVLDLVGLPFRPPALLAAALAGGLGALALILRDARRDNEALVTMAAILGGAFTWLLWIARPALFPLGGGPDLTHHLLLVRYIEQHWRLVHEATAETFLGEMVHYTPGSHILAAVLGAWSGTNGLSAMQAVLAFTVALKAGFVFLAAVRMLPRDVPRVPIAAAGAISLFASQAFFLGSFVEFSFLAQVVAELFAVAMWWALTVWDDAPEPAILVFYGLAGAALFLTWPVLIGPPVLMLGLLVVLPRSASYRTRAAGAAVALLPIAIVALLFIAGRSAWIQIAGTGGKTAWPGVGAYGWPFLAASSLGLLSGAWHRRGRSAAIFAASLLMQAAVLYWVARRARNVPYMALKMFYPLVCAQAAGVALALGDAWHLMGPRLSGWLRRAPGGGRREPRGLPHRLAWAITACIGILVARPLRGAPQSLVLEHRPAASRPLALAGEWARTHVPVDCVEYLVGNDDTAYWLHLAVLGNPRMSARTGDNDTYELAPTLLRWLTPGGLRWAIADLPALPRDVRDELDIVARFDSAVVARRRGPSSCPESR